MEEVLTRRFRNYLRERDEGAHAGKRFSYPPNLLVVDGGKGQLGVAVRVLEELGLEDICVASLAKKFEEVYLPGPSEPVRIPRDSEALYLLQQVRDEAHRFAITYHRQLRGQEDDACRCSTGCAGLGPGPQAAAAQRGRFGEEAAGAVRGGLARAVRGCPTRSARPCTSACTASTHPEPAIESAQRDDGRDHGRTDRNEPATRRHDHHRHVGRGRSEAAHVLEDLGFFVIDNLPPMLIGKVAELARGHDTPLEVCARRRRALRRLPP